MFMGVSHRIFEEEKYHVCNCKILIEHSTIEHINELITFIIRIIAITSITWVICSVYALTPGI